MKDKKLIILYILMLVIGFALLFTHSSSNDSEPVVATPPVTIEPPPKTTEFITVAVANNNIEKRKILTASDYSFKSIEINPNEFDKSKYVGNALGIEGYVSKNNIQKGTLIENSFIASPNSQEFISLSLDEGSYMFPFSISKEDSYLINNLKTGDLIDIYVLYGTENANTNTTDQQVIVSPPRRNFQLSALKPIIVGKRILFITNDLNSDGNNARGESTTGQINLALSNEEIKIIRTLRESATIVLYPSTYNKPVDEGMYLLSDEEKDWPLSDEQIFNRQPITKLRGN